eukprot:gb/GEZN01000338.1/.p1 GENE.gb/GEZN01000338.1/~~gb/GEZN01000338.1/.p1  ORF type:complete len:1111 (+),score=165.65 gb/GEZN01000338.1/:1533-4865(+)
MDMASVSSSARTRPSCLHEMMPECPDLGCLGLIDLATVLDHVRGPNATSPAARAACLDSLMRSPFIPKPRNGECTGSLPPSHSSSSLDSTLGEGDDEDEEQDFRDLSEEEKEQEHTRRKERVRWDALISVLQRHWTMAVDATPFISTPPTSPTNLSSSNSSSLSSDATITAVVSPHGSEYSPSPPHFTLSSPAPPSKSSTYPTMHHPFAPVLGLILRFLDPCSLAKAATTCNAFSRQATVLLTISMQRLTDHPSHELQEAQDDRHRKQHGFMYIHRCAFRGFLSKDRARIWKHLIYRTSPESQDVSREALAALLYQNYPFDNQAKSVVLDTLARHPQLTIRRAKAQDSLNKIIKGVIVFDAELAGVTELGPLAAVLLFPPHLSDYDVICCLRRLLHGRYKLRELFSGDHWQLGLLFYQFSRLVRKFLPHLADHLQKLKLEAYEYTVSWYSSVCIECVSVPVALRIWDLFLVEGWPVIHRVVLSFFDTHKALLLQMHTKQSVLAYLSQATERQHSGQSALPNPYKFDLPAAFLAELETQYTLILSQQTSLSPKAASLAASPARVDPKYTRSVSSPQLKGFRRALSFDDEPPSSQLPSDDGSSPPDLDSPSSSSSDPSCASPHDSSSHGYNDELSAFSAAHVPPDGLETGRKRRGPGASPGMHRHHRSHSDRTLVDSPGKTRNAKSLAQPRGILMPSATKVVTEPLANGLTNGSHAGDKRLNRSRSEPKPRRGSKNVRWAPDDSINQVLQVDLDLPPMMISETAAKLEPHVQTMVQQDIRINSNYFDRVYGYQIDDEYSKAAEEALLRVARTVDQKQHWNLMRNDENLQVWHIPNLPSSRLQTMARGHLPFSVKQLLEILRDPTRRPSWDEMCAQVEVLDQLPKGVTLLYIMFRIFRWCKQAARDVCLVTQSRRLPDGTVIMACASVTHPKCHPKPGIVRATLLESGWVLRPLGRNQTEATYVVHADLKQDIPAPFSTKIQSRAAQNAVRQLGSFARQLFEDPDSPVGPLRPRNSTIDSPGDTPQHYPGGPYVGHPGPGTTGPRQTLNTPNQESLLPLPHENSHSNSLSSQMGGQPQAAGPQSQQRYPQRQPTNLARLPQPVQATAVVGGLP